MEAKVVQGVRDEIQLNVILGKTLADLAVNLGRNIHLEMEIVGIIIPNRKLTEK